MNKKVYRIPPLLDDSFDKTLRELIKFILSDFDVNSVSYAISFSPDTVQVSSFSSNLNFYKPEYVYATFNFCSEYSWTNNGGHRFCECKLKDKSKILINWSISTEYKKIEEFSMIFIRKIKLKQIEK